MPVYVGGTVNFGVAGMGPTVEEGLKGVVDVVLAEVGKKNKEGREGKGGL